MIFILSLEILSIEEYVFTECEFLKNIKNKGKIYYDTKEFITNFGKNGDYDINSFNKYLS